MEASGKIKKGVGGRKGGGPKKKPVTRFVRKSMAVRNNEELGKLLSGVTIAHGGVLPNINHVLLPKKTDKASKEPKSPSKATNTPRRLREQMLKVQVVDRVEGAIEGGADEGTPFEASLK
ncbi:hypothetical protein PHAVU_003G037000 [Phaseolus vulgaris]|uniref:Histone H2A C-terminal domain-containing protein n=1 Tax=Phaseolus vulgaris TaxID=3885 RepID=V7C953_PHAVU|nr:hypothetical protein PHAVU_003G037000g [Phaseolus vulgaris]ESW25451.1 hypothetical protein PHAVU_003G037000g [Phaseolus vulgaris]